MPPVRVRHCKNAPCMQARANAERNFQMAEAKSPVCQKEAKANARRPWPCASAISSLRSCHAQT
jgi:hypothetical protein